MSDDALWVYCVVWADRDAPAGVPGVAGRGDLRLIESGDVAAVAGPVPLSEFGEDALKRNLNDLMWLERTVRAHEAVVDELLPGGPVVPMRVCTIYRDEAPLAEMLEERAPVLRDALRELDGKSEWGVQIVADRDRVESHAREGSDAARALAAEAGSGPAGAAYLARKKLSALVRDESDALLTDVVRDTHARLEEWAAASVTLPAQNKQLSGYVGDMVFNGAYLVEDDRAAAFTGVRDELESQYASIGLTFRLTGPWPAYNFAGMTTRTEARR